MVDGVRFHSKKEATYYILLKGREREGEVRDIVLQPAFPLSLNGTLICTYKADFQFYDFIEEQLRTIEVKGFRTPVYNLKMKLMRALYPLITIEEV